jgi:hypothetical protein
MELGLLFSCHLFFQAAAATTAPAREPIPQPSSVVTVGPGSVISVRVLGVAFAGKDFVVTYGTGVMIP